MASGLRTFRAISVLLYGLCGALLFGQRADRAVITGVVTDPHGYHVADSSVTIRNDATGVETKMVTNEAGDYTSPPLVLGTYTVTVEQQGFKTFVKGGVLLEGGQVVRVDAALDLGAISEKVEVSAPPRRRASAAPAGRSTPRTSPSAGCTSGWCCR